MLMYCKTSSERASKGQGGNKLVSVEITADEGNTVMLQATMECEETPTETIYRLFNGDIQVDTLRVAKGKQETGETTCKQQNCKNKANIGDYGVRFFVVHEYFRDIRNTAKSYMNQRHTPNGDSITIHLILPNI